MGAHVPDARLIYVVRNPLERIESHYNYLLYEGRISHDERIYEPHFIAVSRYMSQLKIFGEFFRNQKVLVLNFRNLINEAGKTLKEVLEFLHLDCNFEIDNFPVSNKSEDYSLARHIANRCKLNTVFPGKFVDYVLGLIALKTYPRKSLSSAEKAIILGALEQDKKEFKAEFGWYPT